MYGISVNVKKVSLQISFFSGPKPLVYPSLSLFPDSFKNKLPDRVKTLFSQKSPYNTEGRPTEWGGPRLGTGHRDGLTGGVVRAEGSPTLTEWSTKIRMNGTSLGSSRLTSLHPIPFCHPMSRLRDNEKRIFK